MKYQQSRFSVGGSTAAYRDGWERVFGSPDEKHDGNVNGEVEESDAVSERVELPSNGGDELPAPKPEKR